MSYELGIPDVTVDGECKVQGGVYESTVPLTLHG